MAKLAAKVLNLTVNSVALEGYLSGSTLDINQATPVVTAISDAGPRRVVDNYDYTLSGDGFMDGASGAMDATIFALIGGANGGVAFGYDPTGASAGANDPNYDGFGVLSSLSIAAQVGGPVTQKWTMLGSAAIARSVS